MHFKLLLLVLVMTAYYQRFSTIVASMTIKGLKFEGCQRYIYIYIYKITPRQGLSIDLRTFLCPVLELRKWVWGENSRIRLW